jgi:type I restriction enzyme R subunit
LFESTGQITHYTDTHDPAPRAREVFHFFTPAHFVSLLVQPSTLRQRLHSAMPALPERNLRDCQISAVTGLEASLAVNKPRALVHMAKPSPPLPASTACLSTAALNACCF